MATSKDTSLTINIREQFLSCKICLDELKLPKTLPCLHTFCAQCLHFYIEHNNVDGRKFSCPVCRRQIYIPKNGVAGFPDSFFVASLDDLVSRSQNENHCGICRFRRDIKTPVNLCVDCKIRLCDECSIAHHTAKVTEGHTLLPISMDPDEDKRENHCRAHRGETIRFYCETCNSPVCLPCTFLEHREHRIEHINTVRDSFNQDMTALVMQSKDSITQLIQNKADLAEIENELFTRKEQAKTQVRKAVQDLMKTLNEQEAELMNQLDDFFDIVSVSRDRQRSERAVFRLERAHDFAKQLLSTDTSPIAQIVNSAEAKESLHQAIRYELPDIATHADKLKSNCVFLPGHHDFNVGSFLTSSVGSSSTIRTLRPQLPSTKALYLHSLKAEGIICQGEVLAVAFLPSGNPVVLTFTGKKVKVFTTRGNLKLEFGDDEDLQHPSDLTITRDSNIAVTDCGLLAVKIFDQFGNLRWEFGDADLFQLPIAIATDVTGKLLVCDQMKQRITVHRDNGDLLRTIDIPEVATPQFISCCRNKLYICDGENKEVAIYQCATEGGNSEIQFRTKLTAPDTNSQSETTERTTPDTAEDHVTQPTAFCGEFLDCSSICTDTHGNLFILDARMDKIHVVNEQGEISSVIPCGKTLRRPVGVAVSTEGLLAVAQLGVDDLEERNTFSHVNLYRLLRAD